MLVFKCKKHPKYMAIKYPPSKCAYCLAMWTTKQFFDMKLQKLINQEKGVPE